MYHEKKVEDVFVIGIISSVVMREVTKEAD